MNTINKNTKFENELRRLINCNSMENGSNTPDFILAAYLLNCLLIYNATIKWRDKWYGVEKKPFNTQPLPTSTEGKQQDDPDIVKELNAVIKELVQEVRALKYQMEIMREKHPFNMEEVATLNKRGIE